ncbi:MAG TPA: TonB family protein [Candidatus Acidoferrum sp.]|nr:TonB family protein [Candidatus Acidoferrum sp.]
MSKEPEILTATPDSNAPTTPRFEDTATTRPQPVALEIPVTVNGARSVEGSDKREPFSETTKTVLVFGGGAVIRLGSPVSSGQLLFLTNEKTKKEVVCQVVKSKNYRNVSGYVELEFTEPVVGFWGMRFPSDRVTAPASAVPAHQPVISKGAASAPKLPEPAPVSRPVVVPPPQTTSSKPVSQSPPPSSATSAPVQPPAKLPEVPAIPAPSLSGTLASSIVGLLDGKPPQTNEIPSQQTIAKELPAAPVSFPADNPTEDLKQQTARLQAQLSSLLFDATPAANAGSTTQASKSGSVAAENSKSLDSTSAAPASPKPVIPFKTPPLPAKSSLDSEELSIPSWLEPLARNAASSAPAREAVETEKAPPSIEPAPNEESHAQLATEAEVEQTPNVAYSGVGGILSLGETSADHQESSGGSRKGMWIGLVAAVALLAAGGAWYVFHPTNAAHGTSTAISAATSGQTISTPPVSNEVHPSETVAPPSESTPLSSAQPVSSPKSTGSETSAESRNESANPSRTGPAKHERERNAASAVPTSITERVPRSAPEPEVKKPSLGQVHLESPTLNHGGAVADTQAVAPTLAAGGPGGSAEGLDSSFASAKQPASPAVPLPVGGDVKPARLISHVAPVYPAMANNQHVSGDVVIDALIDATGRVTTMKVISGPALLRQAAKDALHQWRYQPASLDGKAVSMHLTVTLQFRLQ